MIGILRVPGIFRTAADFDFSAVGHEAVNIRKPDDLDTTTLAGLIIPGGRSPVILKEIYERSLDEAIVRAQADGLPVWGLCAGMVVMASDAFIAAGKQEASRHQWKELQDNPLGLIEMTVARYGLGRYAGDEQNFSVPVEFPGMTVGGARMREMTAMFSEAPYGWSWSGHVQPVGYIWHHDCWGGLHKPVAFQQGKCFATSFWDIAEPGKTEMLKWWLNLGKEGES